MVYITLAILIFFYLNFTYSQLCPPSEDVFPCKCHGPRNVLSGQCAGLTTLKELQNSIRGFHGTKFDTFSISDSIFEYIPYDLFENVTIHHLDITKSNFSRIGNLGDPQFQGLEKSLESLSLTSSFTSSNPFAYVNMGHLQKLKSLESWDNHVEVLHNAWFKDGPFSLEEVRFVKGKIRVVGHKALQSLHNLIIVDLSENDITHIPRSAFPETAVFLEELYLERNKLDQLSDDFFSGMSSLMMVNLELNQFSTIGQTLWENVWSHLVYVNIGYNPLVCDKNIKWMLEKGAYLEKKLTATCYKPFHLMDRDLHSLTEEEVK